MVAQNLSRQAGVVLLSTVTLLLVLSAMSVFYLVKVKTTQFSIAVNRIQQAQAKVAAESGVRFAIAQIQSDPHWTDTSLGDGINIHAIGTIQTKQSVLQTQPYRLELIELTSTGHSDNRTLSQTAQAQLLISPILKNIPDAPLIINGQLDTDDRVYLIANPDGAGVNQPVSIWGSESVGWHLDSVSCLPDVELNNRCLIEPLSDAMHRGADIIASSANFPTDLFAYGFNLPYAQMQKLKYSHSIQFSDCADLGPQSNGVFWVEQACHLSLHQQVGQADAPVILLLQSPSMVLPAQASIYGLVVALNETQISTAQDAIIHGALVLRQGLAIGSNQIQVHYTPATLMRLQSHPFLQVAVIKGSWRDY